jgi:hypothetical protein
MLLPSKPDDQKVSQPLAVSLFGLSSVKVHFAAEIFGKDPKQLIPIPFSRCLRFRAAEHQHEARDHIMSVSYDDNV